MNAIPVFIASDPEWAARFTAAGLPIVGDDIKSQVGATTTHRAGVLMEDRGMAIDRTYQLNFGGNMDFKNMLERSRLESKKKSKTQSVTSQIEQGIESDNVHIGPSDHVPWLEDRKWAYIRLEGRNFGDVPLNIELKLEGLAELGRRDHRRGALLQDRARPRDRRAAARSVGVLHEVAGRAVPRRRRPAVGPGIRRRRPRQLTGVPGHAPGSDETAAPGAMIRAWTPTTRWPTDPTGRPSATSACSAT